MFKFPSIKLAIVVVLLSSLLACATETSSESSSSAVGGSQPAGIVVQERPIDWDRAAQDAKQGNGETQKQSPAALYAVPLLLPPSTLSVSSAGLSIEFSEPKIITDAKGYSAVIATNRFDLLIDASNQMLRTNDAAAATYPQDFNGQFQSIENGAQLTIGRYGALYAIQFVCTDNSDGGCVSEQIALELVQAMQVQLP